MFVAHYSIMNLGFLYSILSNRFIPVSTTQEYASLELYTTDLADVKYMDPSMTLAATLLVPLSRDVELTPTDLPVRIQFIQDVSASMSEDRKLEASIDGLKMICQKLTEGDEIGLVKFSSRVNTIRLVVITLCLFGFLQ